MSAEPQFLSFKGLKQYSPEDGWAQVHTLTPQSAAAPKAAAPSPAVPHNVPTLTDTLEAAHNDASHALSDPSMESLLEQLRAAPNDSLTHTWRTVAAEVNLLTQRMALQRELKERLRQLDQDLVKFCSEISIPFKCYSSEHFHTERYEASEFFKNKKTWLMESFYRYMRKKHHVLMSDLNEPIGSKWNFDSDNRKAW